MLDITSIKKPYFEVKTYHGVLHLKAPKIKTLRKLMNMYKKSDQENPATVEDVEDLFGEFQKILSKNKENKVISMEEIEKKYDISDIMLILTELIKWVNEVNSEKN